jgi:hypothetical protein
MSVHCYTSISLNYLAKARVLGATVKRHHPEWVMTLCVTDRQPDGFTLDLDCEPFDRVIWAEDLLGDNALSWIFQHDVVEVCTAIKGPVMHHLCEAGADKVIYLDPDTAVFNRLDPLLEILDESSIVLTPHQLAPEETAAAIVDNEICSLAHGTYNLGFIAITNDANGKKLAKWWNDRLLKYCIDDKPTGLFVDQKWCDLVPALFDGVRILRDPGYNVASWNLSNRKISFGIDGTVCVNGEPLRFFHFTKLGPVGDTMTQKYAKDNVDVYELWTWYKRQVDASSTPLLPSNWWYYATFSNGEKIPKSARRLYRDRQDLIRAFPNPFDASEGGYFAWLRNSKMI